MLGIFKWNICKLYTFENLNRIKKSFALHEIKSPITVTLFFFKSKSRILNVHKNRNSITLVIITLINLMTDVYIFFVYYIVIKFMYYLSDFEAADNSVCIKIVYFF